MANTTPQQSQEGTPEAASVPMMLSGPPLPSYSSLKTSHDCFFTTCTNPSVLMPEIPDHIEEGAIIARFYPRFAALPCMQGRDTCMPMQAPPKKKFCLRPRRSSPPAPTLKLPL